MKKQFSFIVTLWWVIVLAGAGILLLIVSEKKSTESGAENRYLQGFPEMSVESLASGDFMDRFEDFLSDAFFGRDTVIRFTDDMLDGFNRLSEDEKAEMKAADMEAEITGTLYMAEEDSGREALPQTETAAESDEAVSASETAESEPAPDTDPNAYSSGDVVNGKEFLLSENKSYIWYVRRDGALVVSASYSRKDLETYSGTLRRILSCLPEDGNVLFTQVPLASAANRWYDQQNTYTGWGSSVETMLEDCLKGEDRIHVFSTIDILAPHIPGDTYMYYHNDHHWTTEGAYLVACEMLKAQGLPVIAYDEYKYKSQRSDAHEKGIYDEYNMLYPLLPTVSQVITRRNKIEEISTVHNYSKNTYRAFTHATQLPYRRFLTGADTGRKCLVICDSFGNNFSSYLFPYYDEVHMCDFRPDKYYDISQVGGTIAEQIAYYGIDDVYVITSTLNGLSNSNSLVNLKRILG